MPRLLAVLLASLFASIASAAEPTPTERGKKALTETAFIPAFWSSRSVPNAWRQWEGITQRPAEYDAAFRNRYGLHEAPYPNDGLPMGLRKAKTVLGIGVGADCMMCHGGSILGTSYIGLGNSTLDI
ncbi:MAG TPA: hypothetical protein VKE74_28555, partial [Gemmataceae bacterium]|nr:hypothetical protein [Gemmataceae bacterium]